MQKSATLFTHISSDDVFAQFSELLEPLRLVQAHTWEEAVRTESDLLILYLPVMGPDSIPVELIGDLRHRKVLAIGYTGLRVYRDMDLHLGEEIHLFSTVPPICVQASRLLGPGQQTIARSIDGPVVHQSLGVSITRDLVPFLDVIATYDYSEGWVTGAVVRQGTFAYASVADPPERWTDDYGSLFLRVVRSLAESPFEAPRYEPPSTLPGQFEFSLLPVTSGEACREEFFFKLEAPTALTATLWRPGRWPVSMNGRERLRPSRNSERPSRSIQVLQMPGQGCRLPW